MLAPIKLTVEALCRRDANLCTADAVLKLLLKQLSGKNSALTNKMKTSFVGSIKERLRNELTGVLNYLQNPRRDEENQLSDLEWINLFPVPTQALVRNKIKRIIESLNSQEQNETQEEERSQIDVNQGN